MIDLVEISFVETIPTDALLTDGRTSVELVRGWNNFYVGGFSAVRISVGEELEPIIKDMEIPGASYVVAACNAKKSDWGLVVRPLFRTNETPPIYTAYIPRNFVEAAKQNYADHGLDFASAEAEVRGHGLCLNIASDGFAKINTMLSNRISLDIPWQ